MLINDQSSTAITSAVPMFAMDAMSRITIRRALTDQRDTLLTAIARACRDVQFQKAQALTEQLDEVERVLAAVRACVLAD